MESLRWLATDDGEGLASEWRRPEAGGETLAYLQYTSGSTAAPKGVMVTHANLLHNLAMIYDGVGYTPDSQMVSWLPPYHDMGMIGVVLQALYGGFPAALMSPVSFAQRPLSWLQAISRLGADSGGAPNFAYDLLARRVTLEERATLDLSSWKVAFNGAEPIRQETLEAVRGGLRTLRISSRSVLRDVRACGGDRARLRRFEDGPAPRTLVRRGGVGA
jgi:acyl-CoA synthetase (AMP-forming)/AMP-acid ligase II